jgi:hypothetical protein
MDKKLRMFLYVDSLKCKVKKRYAFSASLQKKAPAPKAANKALAVAE